MSSDKKHRPRRLRSTYSSLTAHGEPWVWLTGGALALAIMMITGLLAFIAFRGASTFWPVPLELVELADGGRALGEVTEREAAQIATAKATGRGSRRLVRTANFEVSGHHYQWFDDAAIARVSRPEWATVVERLEGGRFHGFPVRLLHGEEVVATGPGETWKAYEREHPVVRRRWREAMRIDRHERGKLQRQLRAARLAVVQAGLDSGSTPPGAVTTAVRIAINNLAGVPSIVYGAFGLGFFCYALGGGIDELFFRASLVADNQPTFGTGGLLWASLTLALLTLPVVIVATEEALSAVPNSMREGSYACGAGKWQTIRRIVLPRALPGIMTGLILAMARGAGEVAPLMLVGVKKLALDLPIDGTFPFVHPEREFMHLAYLIYDVGFQSPNSQAAKPMVFTITFLLVTIIALLNVAAIWIRSRLKRRYVSQQF